MTTSTDAIAVTLAQPVHQQIERLLAAGQRRLLGIVAPPGAGKSTLAAAIKAEFMAAVQVVPMDGFHLANSELARLGRSSRKGAPDTFDAAGFVHLLRRLKAQAPDEVIYAPDFRRDIEEAIAGAIAVPADTRLIVTEGNYLLLDDQPWQQVRQIADEIWYLDVIESVRHARLLARHIRHGRTPQQAQDWISATDMPNAKRIEQTRRHAHWCLCA